MEKGKLFIFEGNDGVGKTTIVKEISKILRFNNISHTTYSFPGTQAKTLGSLVYDFHHNLQKYIDYELNPISLQLLHVASHIDLLVRNILPDLEQGRIVLLDRSWISTYVYGRAKGLSEEQIKLILAPELKLIENLTLGNIFLIKRKNFNNRNHTTQKILIEYDNLLKQYDKSFNTIQVVHNDTNLLESVNQIKRIILKDISKDKTFDACNGSYPSHKQAHSLCKPIPSALYDKYWEFAAKRQRIFFDKINKKNLNKACDPILTKYKFTNVYRASDRVSQYLIKNIIYDNVKRTPEDVLFRILLFKLFNKIDTWETLLKCLGEISYDSYNFEKYDKILSNELSNNVKIYSAAYIMPSGTSTFKYPRKHQNNLALIEMMLKDNLVKKITEAKSLQELYHLLLDYPTLGKFLAFQLSIDINYSELCNFDEMSFVVAGPGAHSGIQKCFTSLGNYTDEDIIKYMAENQEKEFQRLGLDFQTLWGRPLQLIDCQNLFCEIDKYSRVAYPNVADVSGRKRIKQLYKASDKGVIKYFYPPKWGINKK